MKIVFGGHLDRAFRLGTHPNRFPQEGEYRSAVTANAGEDPYLSYFHQAGMIHLLSGEWIDHTSLSPDLPTPRSRRRPDGATYEAISLRELEDNAQFFAQMLTQIDALSRDTLVSLRLRAHDDPHKPNAVQQVEDILISALHAWVTNSTLVLSVSDGQALAEIATSVLEHGIPLPFGIPDLRETSRSNPRASGLIANLQPSDRGYLRDLFKTPSIRLYRNRVRRLADSRNTDYATGLASALQEVSKLDPRLREAPADIRVSFIRSKVIDNAGRPGIIQDPLGWSSRCATKGKLQVILASNFRNLC